MFIAPDGFDRRPIILDAQTGDRQIDEIGFVARISENLSERGGIRARPWVRLPHEPEQMSLRGSNRFRSPESIWSYANPRLHGGDLGSGHFEDW